jgi:hypothetical protein
MAEWHLTDLRNALERRGWRFEAELPGDEYRVSGTWVLSRSGRPDQALLIDFDGLDDMRTLPLNESYGCSVRGTTNSLYFLRRSSNDPPARHRWVSDLDSFVKKIG